MRALWITFVLALTPLPSLAQDGGGFFSNLFGTDAAESDEEQGGMLETFIEDNLSGEGRTVSITGFEGALSGRATLDTLTISDADGPWLSLTDVVLDWSRAALFRGALEVNELTAATIELPRLPAPAENEAPTPEARGGFSLPELPVSVQIGRLFAERVDIGQPVFGTAALVSVDGGFALADGAGNATLEISKLDASGGFVLNAAYSNSSDVLALDLDVNEGPDGILAGLLDLPGRPALEFQIAGEAPLTAYAADIRLATDGQERLTGRVETEQLAAEDALRIRANLSGDIAPVFTPEYRPFFGPDVSLNVTATTYPDGRLTLADLDVSARALTLTGGAEIGPDGLPDRIDLNGAIRADEGPVLLPLSGPETRVDEVILDVSFVAAQDDLWTGTFDITGLDRPGFSAAALSLDGQGAIVSTGTRAVTAALTFDATRLDLGDPNAAEALGERVEGALGIAWQQGSPIRLSDLSITGESYGLTGDANIALAEGGPRIDGQASVTADQLSVFSGIAGRTLGGAARLDTEFALEPLAGLFDISASGETTDLVVSQAEADRILAGEAQLALSATRDETGIRVVLDELNSPNASLTGQGTLRSGGSSLSLSGSLVDAALVLPAVTGPVRLTASANEDNDRVWTWSADAGMDGTRLSAEGTAIDIYDTPVLTAFGRLEIDDLSDFASLANRPLSGSIATNFSTDLVADLSRASATLEGTVTDLTTGIAEADTLLAGTVDISLDASMAGAVYSLNTSTVNGPEISLTANGTLIEGAGRARLSGRITDAAKILPGAPNAPFTFSASGNQDGRDWTVEAAANGAGIDARVDGVVLDPFATPLSTAGFDGQITTSIADLSVLSDIAKRPLRGQISVDASGNITTDFTAFDVQATASGAGLSVGIAEADRLLAGNLSARVDASRMGDTIDLGQLALTTDLLDISANGSLGDGTGTIDLNARLADVAPFVTGISGPLSVTGTIGQSAERYTLDLAANGAGGVNATVRGNTAPDGSAVDIDIDGSAPLALADRFIAPRSVSGTVGFDLNVSGPPALSSVSGVISTSGARLVAPTLLLALNNISSSIRLNNGQAQISLAGAIENGGTISIEGPVALSAPFNADLGIALNDVLLTDPRIYETTIAGRVTITGPLTGGARIAGDLALGETNIRIPSSSLGGAGAVPEIIHLNETPPVRATRRRAGFVETASSQGSGGPGFPLDIRVSAPNRLFVRGRGLDSEFGGSLRITGNTNNAIPIGAFNLVRGRLDILGQRLVIEEAAITIQGDFIPILQIRATTEAEEYTIAVIVDGPASDPEITFTSEPDLPQEEVLASLIFGRGLDTLSPIQAARLALAVRTLAGQGGEGIVGNIRQGAGLADLDVTTDEEGNTAVRAGAYLGENLYTDVTVGSGGETELNLNLDVSRSVTLKGSVTSDGDTSVGVFFERDY